MRILHGSCMLTAILGTTDLQSLWAEPHTWSQGQWLGEVHTPVPITLLGIACLGFPAGTVVVIGLTSCKVCRWAVLCASAECCVIPYPGFCNGSMSRKPSPNSTRMSVPHLTSVQDSCANIIKKAKRIKKGNRQTLKPHPPPCPSERISNNNDCQIISCRHSSIVPVLSQAAHSGCPHRLGSSARGWERSEPPHHVGTHSSLSVPFATSGMQ